jgi:hypothetical protein
MSRGGNIDTAMLRRIVLILVAGVCAALAQKYAGPRPPKPDIPYLKHADNLVATEVVQAKESKEKEDTLYTIEGANSPARTPLAEPIFLFQSNKLQPGKLQLFKLEENSGHREILFGKNKSPMSFRMEVTRLTSDNLYKLEVDEELMPAEYTLGTSGSDLLFCFQVF